MATGFFTVRLNSPLCTCSCTATQAGPACRRALLSPPWTIRYASRETTGGTPAWSPESSAVMRTPAARVRRNSASRPSKVGAGAATTIALATSVISVSSVSSVFSSLDCNRPRTVSSSATASRVVSSMAASACRANSGSVSSTRRAAPAWRVTALSAWPTASCSSRASRLRAASSAARRSAAASRSAGVGPSSTGAQRASSTPAPQPVPNSRASRTSPAAAGPTTELLQPLESRCSTPERPGQQQHRGRWHGQRHPADDPAGQQVRREPQRTAPPGGPRRGRSVGQPFRGYRAQRPDGGRLQRPVARGRIT